MFGNICALVVLLTVVPNNLIVGHKILVIVTVHGKSHWNYMKVFIDELLNRGNEITCITSVTIGNNKPENYTEVLIEPPYSKENLSKFYGIPEWSAKSAIFVFCCSGSGFWWSKFTK